MMAWISWISAEAAPCSPAPTHLCCTDGGRRRRSGIGPAASRARAIDPNATDVRAGNALSLPAALDT